MNPSRLLVAALFTAAPVFAHATEMFTPPLPAAASQTLTCGILNASTVTQNVVIIAHDSNGAMVGGPSSQTLAPGQTGGFAMPGWYAGMYCHFRVKIPSDWRAAISVSQPLPNGEWQFLSALPAN